MNEVNSSSGLLRLLSAVLCTVLTVAGCGATENDIVGNWQADDGSGTKTITEDGQCTGMYYNGGEPLDIGGVTTCSFSDQPGSTGTHTMVVTQPPNQQTLRLKFLDSDSVEIYDGSEDLLFTMTRQ